MKLEAVFFDMDGVLVDSVGIKHAHRQQFLKEDLGLDIRVNELVGLTLDNKYNYLVQHTDINISKSEFHQRFDKEIESVYTNQVSLIGNFHSLMEILHDQNIKVGLVTASSEHRMKLVLDRFSIRGHFDIVLSVSEIDGASKPEPDIYQEAIKRTNVKTERSVAIEDSYYGAKAATQAGLYCIGYQPPENPKQNLSIANEQVSSSERLYERFLDLMK